MSTSDMLNFFTKLYSYIRQLNSRQTLKGKSPSANLMFLFNPANSSIVKVMTLSSKIEVNTAVIFSLFQSSLCLVISDKNTIPYLLKLFKVLKI